MGININQNPIKVLIRSWVIPRWNNKVSVLDEKLGERETIINGHINF